MSPAVLPISLSAPNVFHFRKSRQQKVRRTSALPVQLDVAPPLAASLPYRVFPKLCLHQVLCHLPRVERRWSVLRKWYHFGNHLPSSNVKPTNIANVVSHGRKSISNKPQGKSAKSYYWWYFWEHLLGSCWSFSLPGYGDNDHFKWFRGIHWAWVEVDFECYDYPLVVAMSIHVEPVIDENANKNYCRVIFIIRRLWASYGIRALCR